MHDYILCAGTIYLEIEVHAVWYLLIRYLSLNVSSSNGLLAWAGAAGEGAHARLSGTAWVSAGAGREIVLCSHSLW